MIKSYMRLNIIILARNHNPAIPTKDWLIKNKIFNELPEEFINTPVFSVFRGKKYYFQIDENKLEFTLRENKYNLFKEAIDKVRTYVSILPETPYASLGLNFVWKYEGIENDQDVIIFLKDKFCNEKSKFNELFSSEDWRFGCSFIFSYDNLRITLRVTPHIAENNFLVDFNFHSNLQTLPSKEKSIAIKGVLDNFDDYHKKALSLQREIFGEVGEQ